VRVAALPPSLPPPQVHLVGEPGAAEVAAAYKVDTAAAYPGNPVFAFETA
jgi:hypothetical protein